MPSLFTSETPSSGNVDEGEPVATATTVIFAADKVVTHIRFFAPATVSGTFTGRLHEVATDDDPQGTGTGTPLGDEVTFEDVEASDWNVAELPDPVPVDTAHAYRPVVHSSNGRFVATNNFFDSGALVNGDITGIDDNTSHFGLGNLRNGTYRDTAAMAYPSNVFLAGCYFVDVVFEAAAVDLTGTASLGGLAGSGTVVRTVAITGAGTLGGLTGAGTVGRTVDDVTGTAPLGALTATGTVGRTVNLTASGALGALAGVGTLTRMVDDITGVAQLGPLTASGSIVGVVGLTGAANLGALTASGAVGRTVDDVTGAASLGGLTAAGALVRTVRFTAAANLGVLTAAGTVAAVIRVPALTGAATVASRGGSASTSSRSGHAAIT